MRIVIATAAFAGAALATTAVALTPRHAHAQTLDRYGGTSAAYAQGQGGSGQYAPPAPSPYPPPAYAQPQAAPSPVPAAVYAPQPTTASAGLRTLNWPGKTDVPAYAAAAARQAQAYVPPTRYVPAQAYTPQPYGAPAYAAQTYMAQIYTPQAYAPAMRYAPNPGATLPASGGVQPPQTVLRPIPIPSPGVAPGIGPTVYPGSSPYAFVQPQPPVARAPLPTSIYNDAPAPAAAPYGPYVSAQAQASAAQANLSSAQRAALLPPPSNDSPSRLYSLHREYGMTPDAAPIPPAFFTASADLTTPETPDAPHTPATASKAQQNAARIAATSGQ